MGQINAKTLLFFTLLACFIYTSGRYCNGFPYVVLQSTDGRQLLPLCYIGFYV